MDTVFFIVCKIYFLLDFSSSELGDLKENELTAFMSVQCLTQPF